MQEWITIDETEVFSAPPYLKVLKQQVDTGEGRIIDDFFQVRLRAFVITIPVLENGNILTITQYKHGLGRVSLTFPAGFVEDGERPEVACRRELLEETGLQSNDVVHLGEFVDNGNQRGCLGNYYVHRGCRLVQEPDSGDLEEMAFEEKSVADIDKAVFNGEIGIVHCATAWSLARLRGCINP